MQIIPLRPVPSQQVQCVLAGQNCQIAVYVRGGQLYVDLNVNGADLSVAVLARNAVVLSWGLSGNLLFIDTQGMSDPFYGGIGSRFQLVYVTAAEALSLIPVAARAPYVQTSVLTDDFGNIIYAPGNATIVVTEDIA